MSRKTRIIEEITLDNISEQYGILNAWSADNLNIVTTTTTALDYKGVHDLANPAAANQPVYNAADAKKDAYQKMADKLIEIISKSNNSRNVSVFSVANSNCHIQLQCVLLGTEGQVAASLLHELRRLEEQ